MPRHSPRPTAGRKPKQPPPGPRVDGPLVVLPPPRDLTRDERAVWRRLAPAAARLGTLVPDTAEGFRLLVEVMVARDTARKLVDDEGLVQEGAPHPLLTHIRQLTQRTEALMAKFALTAPGRAVQVQPSPGRPLSALDRGDEHLLEHLMSIQ